jgi:hypothetical protein
MLRRFVWRNILSLQLMLSTSLWAVSVNGTLVSGKGSPVAQTVVTIIPIASGIVSSMSAYKTITDGLGDFTVTVPGPGTYLVCAASQDAQLLDSCLWPNSAARFQISDASVQSIQVNVPLQVGTSLRFRINDPMGLLPRPGASPAQNSQTNTFLGVGVWTNDGHYYHARIISYDTSGINYLMIVPIGANLRISFQSLNISLLDNTGAPLNPNSSALSFQTDANEAAVVRTFSVVRPN